MYRIKKNIVLGLIASLILVTAGGCNIFGFLSSPGGYEQKYKPKYDLKPESKRKVFVWVDPSPGSGAGVSEAKALTAALAKQLRKQVGVSEKNILVPTNLESLIRDYSVRPETLGSQAGAELVFYVHLTSFQVNDLHSGTIYSGSMTCRGVLLDIKNNKTLWPQPPQEMVADVVIDAANKGREDLIDNLSKAAAHCLLRDLYACRKPDYKINEERSALNEMIQQEVF